jgi:hypothetical protein
LLLVSGDDHCLAADFHLDFQMANTQMLYREVSVLGPDSLKRLPLLKILRPGYSVNLEKDLPDASASVNTVNIVKKCHGYQINFHNPLIRCFAASIVRAVTDTTAGDADQHWGWAMHYGDGQPSPIAMAVS